MPETPFASVSSPMSGEEVRIKTNVSRAYWCDPCQGYTFQPAVIPFIKRQTKDGHAKKAGIEAEQVGWLDQLLDGGLVLPGGVGGGPDKRALTMLLSGSPGTGKSTLALELCARWSQRDANNPPLKERGFRSLYVTTEAHGPWMVKKAADAKWPGCDNVRAIKAADKKITPMARNSSGDGCVDIWPATDDQDFIKRASSIETNLETTWLGSLVEDIKETFLGDYSGKGLHKEEDGPRYDVLVFDSINTVADKETRGMLFDQFKKLITSGPSIVIMVADAQANGGSEDFWDFMSDVVIRMTRFTAGQRYMVRTIEVTKARYQSHVWGTHQLKPYGGNTTANARLTYTGKNKEDYDQDASLRMRAHPYRKNGGIFIFPSIHYILSSLKKEAVTVHAEVIKSAVPGLERLLVPGFPRHRCTALIGSRGGHKSHLAFSETMHRLINDKNERALILTLRDDEGMTRKTLQGILEARHRARLRNKLAADFLRDMERQGRLEISYFPPGYITPEEFFHRVLLSLSRLKHSNADPKKEHEPHVTVVVNSLDQLHSRFPLCAAQEIFVPGIIQMLSSEHASSFFVAADEHERPGSYGLDTMAELILEFSLPSLRATDYLRYVVGEKGLKPDAQITEYRGEFKGRKEVSAVVVKVARYAGGQAAGAQGILELIREGHPLFKHGLTDACDLKCFPMNT